MRRFFLLITLALSLLLGACIQTGSASDSLNASVAKLPFCVFPAADGTVEKLSIATDRDNNNQLDENDCPVSTCETAPTQLPFVAWLSHNGSEWGESSCECTPPICMIDCSFMAAHLNAAAKW